MIKQILPIFPQDKWGGGGRRRRLAEGQLPRPRNNGNLSKARDLRSAQSLPEALLWRLLKGSPDGVRLRRQHAIGRFVLDFYCAKARIAFEIDGSAHDMGHRPSRDAGRDRWLADQGIQVFRIAAAEVLQSPEAVADAIIRKCGASYPSVSG